MIELAFPWALVLLPAPFLIWHFIPPYRQSAPAIRFPFFNQITKAAGAETRSGAVIIRRRNVQMVTAVFVWVLLIVVLARPERVGEPIEISKAARDLILAIDISGSMDERDFRSPAGAPVQRLAAVKDIVGAFVEARQGDRVALIVFGSKAFVQAPFTEDLRTVRDLLEQTEVGMAGPHTALGDAIGLAIRTFEASDIDQRLLILLSDGADTGSRMSPVNAAEIAAQHGAEIHTIGVGKPDATGVNRVDIDMLNDIARRAGGKFFFANDTDGLAAIYTRIDELAPRAVETLSLRSREAVGHWFLAPAVLLTLATLAWLHLITWRQSRQRARDSQGLDNQGPDNQGLGL